MYICVYAYEYIIVLCVRACNGVNEVARTIHAFFVCVYIYIYIMCIFYVYVYIYIFIGRDLRICICMCNRYVCVCLNLVIKQTNTIEA